MRAAVVCTQCISRGPSPQHSLCIWSFLRMLSTVFITKYFCIIINHYPKLMESFYAQTRWQIKWVPIWRHAPGNKPTPGYSHAVIELRVVTRHIKTCIQRWASSPYSPMWQDCFLFESDKVVSQHLRERESEREWEGRRGDEVESPIILAACSYSTKKIIWLTRLPLEMDGPDGVTCRHR